MASSSASILGVARSLSGKTWRWRGGNMELGGAGAASLEHDLVTQLLLARGVPATTSNATATRRCAHSCPIRPNSATWTWPPNGWPRPC